MLVTANHVTLDGKFDDQIVILLGRVLNPFIVSIYIVSYYSEIETTHGNVIKILYIQF